MLKITVNGQVLDLQGIRFTVQLHSPFPFDPSGNSIEGSFAFGAKFPASERNKIVFGFPHRLERFPEAAVDLEGMLFFDGRKLFDITISLVEVTDLYFNVNIKIGIGYYANLVGEKSLRDLSYGGLINLGDNGQDVINHAMEMVSKSYPETSHGFPVIRNPEFYGENNQENPAYCGWMNYYRPGTGFLSNTYDEEGVYNNYNLVPCFYLMFVLRHCFLEHGYLPGGDFFLDTDLQKLLIYNNRSLDLIEDRYTSLADVIEDQLITAETKIRFEREIKNIDSCFDDQEYAYRVLKAGTHRITADILLEGIIQTPGFTVQWYLDVYLGDDIIYSNNGEMMYELEQTVSINFDRDISIADLGKYIFIKVRFKDNFNNSDSTGYVHALSWFSVQHLEESSLNRYQTSIAPADHLPDIKISEFLIRLQKLFGIIYHFDHAKKKVTVMFISKVLNALAASGYDVKVVKSSKSAGFQASRSYVLNFNFPSNDGYTKDNFVPIGELFGEYDTLDDLPEAGPQGALVLIRNLNAIYKFNDDHWAWFTDNFQPLVLGAGKMEIKPDISPLTMSSELPEEGVHLVCPRVKHKGSSPSLGDSESGFRLILYHGMRANKDGDTYPFASCTRYGPTGSELGSLEIRWDGSYGLHEKYLQEYYQFSMNRSRPVEYQRHFTASEIQAIDMLSKYKIFTATFLIDQVSLPITESSIGLATMKLVKS